MNLGATEVLVILTVLLLLLFGASRVPQLARSLGQASSELRKGMAEGAQGPPDRPVDDP